MLAMFQFKKCETVASEMNFWWRQSQTLSNLWWMRWKIPTIYCFLHLNFAPSCFPSSNLHVILLTLKNHCWHFHVCGQSYAIISHYFLVDLFENHRLYWMPSFMFHKNSFVLKLLNFKNLRKILRELTNQYPIAILFFM